MMNDKPNKPVTAAWAVILFIAILVRIPGLTDQSYYWREIQTEMTSYWFQKEGIDLFNYQTPIYGPPWQVPFEFPLYQAASALIANAGIGDIEFASRLTALLCFALSAWLLYLLCREFFRQGATTLLISSLYLLTPYNIYYSMAPQIDYLSVALALGYVYLVLLWLRRRSSIGVAISATAVGALLMLVKLTTAPIAGVPIAAFVVRDILLRYKADLQSERRVKQLLAHAWRERSYWLLLAVMAIAPVAIGSAWTHHADHIKDLSIYTRWLSSDRLGYWTFGTIELRSNMQVWADHINYAVRFLWPYGLSLLAVLGLFSILGIIRGDREPDESALFIASMAGGGALTLVIFLNLYLHDYYYIALSASMAVAAGFGAARFWQLRPILGRAHLYLFAALAAVLLFGNMMDYMLFRNLAASRNEDRAAMTTWAAGIQQLVSADRWIVFVENVWDPIIPYLLERKTMVVTERESDMPICGILSDPHFGLVVVKDRTDPANASNLERALKCFKTAVEIAPGAYQVTH